MKKQVLKLGAVALVFTLAITMLAACGKSGAKTATIGTEHVDVYTYVGNTLSSKLTATGTNKVTKEGNTVRVDVAKNVDEVEFDLAPFFAVNTGYKGKDFYFTRTDVKKGDNTLIKGSAWVEVTPGTATTRLYRKLGSETDTTTPAISKTEIAALADRAGEARMYILTAGTQAGKHIVYIDPTVGSAVEPGTTEVTFKFHGHNNQTAEMKVKVVKASA